VSHTRPGTLPELFDEVAARDPDKTAIVDGERRLTYSELRGRASQIASHLEGIGVKRGAIVSLYLPNGIEFLAGFMAIARLGATVAPLNAQYRERELSYYLADCGASAIVTSAASEPRCRAVTADLGHHCDVVAVDQLASSGTARVEPKATPADALLVQYSSGSTGRPKRIARTHANLVLELASLGRTISATAGDRFLGTVPFSHVNGLVRTMLTSQSVGATLVSLADFQRQKTASAIQQERITIVIAVPFVFGILADTNFRTPVDFSTLRLAISASAPMPLAVNHRFHARFGQYVRQLYGSTETGSISVNMSDDLSSSLESVGTPLAGVEFKVVADNGDLVKPGEDGEVAVKSPFAITAYQNLPPEEQPFRDGYFMTGDVARQDDAGRLYLVGRRKFFINKGGYKINPRELESLLEQHPKVSEVVVVGVAATYGDERVKAIVVPREPCSAEEVMEFCRGRIADFKSPSVVEFRESLPKSSTGKILRSEL
jgi:long-chain acyl-CoA synthetase